MARLFITSFILLGLLGLLSNHLTAASRDASLMTETITGPTDNTATISAPTKRQNKTIALTFDDAPRSAVGYFDGPTRAQKLLTALQQAQVNQVAFFAVSKRIDDEGHQRLMTYAKAGHLIANHTHSHPDFNQTSLEQYQNDFNQADKRLSQYPNFRRWFRYPFLREGDTLEKRDGMRKALAQTGYVNAYITVNNYDWYLESLFQQAIKAQQKIDFDALRDLYVNTMMQAVRYYDQMSLQHTERSVAHVLLLHEMDISALFIDDLVSQLRKEGWTIISPIQAYQDPIAQQVTNNLFKFNPGRIGEIAKDNGQRKGLWHTSLEEDYLKQRFEREVIITDAPRPTAN